MVLMNTDIRWVINFLQDCAGLPKPAGPKPGMWRWMLGAAGTV